MIGGVLLQNHQFLFEVGNSIDERLSLFEPGLSHFFQSVEFHSDNMIFLAHLLIFQLHFLDLFVSSFDSFIKLFNDFFEWQFRDVLLFLFRLFLLTFVIFTHISLELIIDRSFLNLNVFKELVQNGVNWCLLSRCGFLKLIETAELVSEDAATGQRGDFCDVFERLGLVLHGLVSHLLDVLLLLADYIDEFAFGAVALHILLPYVAGLLTRGLDLQLHHCEEVLDHLPL